MLNSIFIMCQIIIVFNFFMCSLEGHARKFPWSSLSQTQYIIIHPWHGALKKKKNFWRWRVKEVGCFVYKKFLGRGRKQTQKQREKENYILRKLTLAASAQRRLLRSLGGQWRIFDLSCWPAPIFARKSAQLFPSRRVCWSWTAQSMRNISFTDRINEAYWCKG